MDERPDLQAELEQFTAERVKRLRDKRMEREVFQQARDAGLRMRHANKLARNRRHLKEADDAQDDE